LVLSASARRAEGESIAFRGWELDLVWGHGTFVTDRVVDNHLITLRKKVEPEPSEPHYIVSVRGMRYRFDG
jgi:DNA-binding response OmpR family regulator